MATDVTPTGCPGASTATLHQLTLNGAGHSVGLLEFDGFYANDVALNFDWAGVPPVPVTTVLLDGVSGAPRQANVEVTLDIMMASLPTTWPAN